LTNKKQDVNVRITKQTVSIGEQTYQLRHIARVQRWEVPPDYSALLSRHLGRGFAMLVILVIANAFLVVAGHLPIPLLQVGDVLAAGTIVVATVVGFIRAIRAHTRYVLLVETLNPVGALRSDDRKTIDDLVEQIADAMENPPDNPKLITVYNVVTGDQINQSGHNNVGKEVSFGG